MNIKNVFKLEGPKRFHYTPRFYKGVEDDNVYKFKSKYRKDEIGNNFNDYRGNWSNDRQDMRTRANTVINSRLVIIFLVLVFFFLFMIDFDLSIFKLSR